MKNITVVPFRLRPRIMGYLKELREMGYGNRNAVLNQAINMLYWSALEFANRPDPGPTTPNNPIRRLDAL